MTDLRPTDPLAALHWDTCLAYRGRPQRIPYVGFESGELAALAALRNTVDGLDAYVQTIEQGLTDEIATGITAERVTAVQSAYDAARKLALPASYEFIKWCHATQGLTYTHGLRMIHWDSLRELEVRSHADSTLKKLLRDFLRRMRQITGVEDHTGFGQAFEFYSEAVVYAYLKERLTTVEKIDEKGGKAGSTPDFRCTYESREFFVEVKSFDLVDGVSRAGQMMLDGLDANLDLEAQVGAGRSIATTVQEIAPYRKVDSTKPYDPRSPRLVIETLKSKAHSAFKASQFKLGPTFAFASMGRLILPDGPQGVLPYYTFSDADGRGIISGVLWQSCFGRKGGVVLRQADFVAGSLDGYLETDGLYCDEHEPLPGIGFIAMESARLDSQCYGLCNDASSLADCGWDLDDVKEILGALCVSYNDRENREANIAVEV